MSNLIGICFALPTEPIRSKKKCPSNGSTLPRKTALYKWQKVLLFLVLLSSIYIIQSRRGSRYDNIYHLNLQSFIHRDNFSKCILFPLGIKYKRTQEKIVSKSPFYPAVADPLVQDWNLLTCLHVTLILVKKYPQDISYFA